MSRIIHIFHGAMIIVCMVISKEITSPFQSSIASVISSHSQSWAGLSLGRRAQVGCHLRKLAPIFYSFVTRHLNLNKVQTFILFHIFLHLESPSLLF